MTIALPQAPPATAARPAAPALPVWVPPSRWRYLADTRHNRRALADLLASAPAMVPPHIRGDLVLRAPGILTMPADNAKLAKGRTPIIGLTLAPSSSSGIVNLCPGATPGCIGACVLTAGNGRYPMVQFVRAARVAAMVADFDLFASGVVWAVRDYARAAGRRIGFRPNVADDIPWERVPGWADEIPASVALFGYSKLPGRFQGRHAAGCPRWALTYSLSERASSPATAARILADGGSVAAVLAGARRRRPGGMEYAPTPAAIRIGGRWWPMVPGDATDARWRDPGGAVVALAGKGSLHSIATGGALVGDRFALRFDSVDLRHNARQWAAWRR